LVLRKKELLIIFDNLCSLFDIYSPIPIRSPSDDLQAQYVGGAYCQIFGV